MKKLITILFCLLLMVQCSSRKAKTDLQKETISTTSSGTANINLSHYKNIETIKFSDVFFHQNDFRLESNTGVEVFANIYKKGDSTILKTDGILSVKSKTSSDKSTIKTTEKTHTTYISVTNYKTHTTYKSLSKIKDVESTKSTIWQYILIVFVSIVCWEIFKKKLNIKL